MNDAWKRISSTFRALESFRLKASRVCGLRSVYLYASLKRRNSDGQNETYGSMAHSQPGVVGYCDQS